MKLIVSKIKPKNFLSIFLAVCMVIAPMSLIITATADPNTFRVSTSEEFVSAVEAINSGNDGEYVIEMQNDITVSGRVAGSGNAALRFNKGITTIYGNGYTLSGSIIDDTLIYLNGDAVIVNLGSETESEKSKITIKGTASDLVGIASGTVNMYEGVVLRDHTANARPAAGVSVGETSSSPNAIFNMHGGTITNCINKYTHYAGGVFVGNGATFNMFGGTISGNEVGQYGQRCSGGGVGVWQGGTFNMSGGVIENNTSGYYGGGVCLYVYGSSTFNMTGGRIENNHSANHGGGIYSNNNTVTINAGVIQNNISDTQGDDLYIKGGTKNIVVSANSENGYGKLNSTGKQINGWFEDGGLYNSSDMRWSKPSTYDVKFLGIEKGDSYYYEIDANSSTASALKAAHNEDLTVIYDINSGVWDSTNSSETYQQNSDGTYSETVKPSTTANEPMSPTKTDYTFLGWFTADGTKYDFNTAVNEDITLYAKWEYNNYRKSVTIDKFYQIMEGYTDAGTALDPEGKLTENITLVIEAYKSFNREVGKTDIPAFAETEYKFTTGIGADEIQLALPDFNDSGVGDYWYKVTETEGNTAGVTYDANEYYMHIIVTHEEILNPDGSGISQITFHKNAPDENGTYINEESDKSTGFTNTYGEGSLTVTNDIKGNFADRTKTFDVAVTFNAPNNKIVTGDIYFGDDTVAVEGGWNTSKTVTITLGLGDTITFKNIPDGVTYTVAENDYSIDGYKNPVYTFDNAEEAGDEVASGDAWDANNAQGTITDDADTVTITNEKNITIDVGVILENAPYAMIILFVISTAAVMFVKRRKISAVE